MDKRLNGPTVSSSSNGGSAVGRSSPTLQPNYSSRLVQEALEHLASIDLIELCKEAKVERCRATRDLRSCGRYVHHVLNSCGHASLCEECSQRCDICPICRIPISKSGAKVHLRLYYECIEAGLISKRCDERFQEIEDGDKQLTADVQRLYSLFDVALENNLVSLICHYITDVCMDETAVSSDPVIAFLLDEVVVKDWCKRTFKNIIAELQGIYNMDILGLKERLSLLLKFSLYLKGISNVLDILESSFKGTLSAQLHDLQNLQESIMKTKQHMDVIIWCTRHQFLEDVRSRFTDSSSWSSVVRTRKSEAIRRAWPDPINQSVESSGHDGSLFIEDAMNNLDLEEGFRNEIVEGLEIASLQKDSESFLGSNTDQILGYYPFKNLRSAVDLLFLRGGSDMVIAKQAIFLYYLYDRHWTIPEEEWRYILEDFAATFSISRHSLLESLTFYLLDDHTEEALQEACRLLPEITGSTSHPKIAEVLLERGSPDTALMVLRWAGRDGGPHVTSLRDAVTAVRVRVECGLLTEAFMHQRMLCTKVKEKNFNKTASGNTSEKQKGQCNKWVEWMEVLVTEICCLCIRRNLVDRMLELPWNSEEEKYIHKCLLDYAIEANVALGADGGDREEQQHGRDDRSRSSWAEVVSQDQQDHPLPHHQHKEQYRPQYEEPQSQSSYKPQKVDEGEDGWQTVGRKPSRHPHKVQKDNWNSYKRPADEQEYSNEVEVGADVEPSEDELADLSRACEKLWALDLNRLVPGLHYEIDCGEGKKVYQKEDMAQGSLFTWVSDDVFRKPTFARFLSLLDNYNPHQGCKEVVTSEERQEQASFIEEISRTAPIKYLHKYLASKQIVSGNYQDFKRMITSLWFDLYGRGGTSGSSSAFEHVFVGETKQCGEVSGFHNWLQFYLEEAKGRVDYQGYIFPRRRGETPDSEAQLLTIQFEWNGVLKSVSSTLVGVSPEFEIALYTLCFYVGREDNHIQLGPYGVNIKCYRLGDRIGSVFPIADS